MSEKPIGPIPAGFAPHDGHLLIGGRTAEDIAGARRGYAAFRL